MTPKKPSVPKNPKILPQHIIMSGRPTTYTKRCDDLAYKLALLGATNIDISKFFEVSDETIREWAATHPTFGDALRRGGIEANTDVAASLYRKAIGYEFKGVYYPPDVTACIFWLKNRCRAQWSDRLEDLRRQLDSDRQDVERPQIDRQKWLESHGVRDAIDVDVVKGE